ncbi:oxidative damage protection protein [Methylovulum psychrotolerans]|jgi:Fe-S cluster biosynthesis and repair protein YggX|uniref:Probable Fe(2+)-trafficking protein n=1 Tax=Methylovulum psychrotolerans TaxID=1704499 RepID=A0A1Z4BVY8_9GAMM|nr:oxidative damage protection protein [Methylovulum psychrotolerans]ASF45464.1 oxidative damage protection protein [Methylovulum psychrotolerans]MBT9099303.1 oxidative damage protection protein [Methylovulum psychrotolerans]POZ49936.1 oxidative damage protection protein [Methylovulum psychrotolerans]
MTRLIHCVKLGEEAEGLDSPPFPGEKGQEIYEKISKSAWQAWLSRQTMLINENKLASFDPKARAYLAEERAKFLFEGHNDMPAGYVPPKA